MNTTSLIVLLFAPLIGFLINVFFGRKMSKNLSGVVGTASVLLSFVITLLLFFSVKQPITLHLSEWFSIGKLAVNFDFVFDQLSILWLLFVTGIGTLIHIYSISYMHDDENMYKFFAYLNLFIFFMITLVAGSNLLIMFIVFLY